jgi:outer membrane murein-binding lipoprotein Lpp
MKSTLQYLAVLCILCVAGCAHKEKVSYVAPSVVAVRTSVEKLKPLVKPEGKKEVSNLETAITAYEVQVDQQAKDLAKAQNDVVYWHSKQEKALKELWFWRGIAIVSILCVVGYIGIKTAWRFAL